MIILLEGSDGTGKTTLAKAICKKLNAHYIHATYRFKDKMFTYHTALLNRAVKLIIKTNRPVVIDRLWASEAVYAEVFRGGSEWGLMGRFMERVINKMGGIHIFCLVNNYNGYSKKYVQLKSERTEMYDDADKIFTVAKMYDNLYWGNKFFIAQRQPSYLQNIITGDGMVSHINTLRYSMGDSLTYQFIDHIGHRLKTLKSPIDYSLTNYCGSLKYSDYLIVGDTANPNKRFLWPFYGYSHSSLYLTVVLNAVNMAEERLFFTNINYDNGLQIVEKWLKFKAFQKMPHKVILLGNNAAKTFMNKLGEFVKWEYKCKVFKTYHPSAAMRHYKYDEQFKDDLFRIFYKEE